MTAVESSFQNPANGLVVKPVRFGVCLFSQTLRWADGPHPDLQSHRGGVVIEETVTDDGEVAWRCAESYRGQVEYVTIAHSDVIWESYFGFVDKAHVRSLLALMTREQHPTRGRSKKDHRAAMRALDYAEEVG